MYLHAPDDLPKEKFDDWVQTALVLLPYYASLIRATSLCHYVSRALS
jgi:hypothetical protein